MTRHFSPMIVTFQLPAAMGRGSPKMRALLALHSVVRAFAPSDES